jgi:hypothetical protein
VRIFAGHTGSRRRAEGEGAGQDGQVGVQADIGQDVAGDGGRELGVDQGPCCDVGGVGVAQGVFEGRDEPADHVVRGQRCDAVHRDLGVQGPHPVGTEPGERVCGGLCGGGEGRRAVVGDERGQLLVKRGPGQGAGAAGGELAEGQQDQQRLVRGALPAVGMLTQRQQLLQRCIRGPVHVAIVTAATPADRVTRRGVGSPYRVPAAGQSSPVAPGRTSPLTVMRCHVL